MSDKRRADMLLVDRGVFASRAQARAAIEAGNVVIAGRSVSKASETYAPDAEIDATPAHPWVSRAGIKLAHALDAFEVSVADKICLDVGASTGGFTQVLLAAGAAHVTAVDVGRGQLAEALKRDPRITSREGLDARRLTPDHVKAPPQVVVCDVSFIGLEKALGVALRLAAEDAEAIVLFKPQFEVGPQAVGRGGVVRDAEATAAALARVTAWFEKVGWDVAGATQSPIRGGDGNVETLLHLRRT